MVKCIVIGVNALTPTALCTCKRVLCVFMSVCVMCVSVCLFPNGPFSIVCYPGASYVFHDSPNTVFL